MILITGIIKVLPVPNTEPPVGMSYQLMMPELEVAPRVTVPTSHLLLGDVPVISIDEFTEAVIPVLDDVQTPSYTST